MDSQRKMTIVLEIQLILVCWVPFVDNVVMKPPLIPDFCDDLMSNFRYDYHYVMESFAHFKMHNAPTTWFAAKRVCRLEGAELAVPFKDWTPSMQNLLYELTESYRVHTGFHCKFLPGYYTSISGKRFSDTEHSWGLGEPDRTRNDQNCLAMDSEGDMYVTDLNEHLPFICFQRHNENLKLNKCGIGTTNDTITYELNDHCYKYHGLPQNWENAMATCVGEGGYLAIINSKEEATYITEMIKLKTSGLVTPSVTYIGMRVTGITGEWLTVFDETLGDAGFEKWSPGEPNGNILQFNCGCLSQKDSLLCDYLCEDKLPFVCEMDNIL